MNPSTVRMTNTLNTRADPISVERRVTRKLIAVESRNTAKFKKSDSGEPRSSRWSSESVTSYIFRRSILPRRMAGRS